MVRKVRLQVPQQPDHLDVAMRLGLQAAGAQPVQILGRIEPRPPRLLCRHPLEAGSSKTEAVYEGLDEANRVVWPDIVVDRLGQKTAVANDSRQIPDLGARLLSFTLEHPDPCTIQRFYDDLAIEHAPKVVEGPKLRDRAVIETRTGTKELT